MTDPTFDERLEEKTMETERVIRSFLPEEAGQAGTLLEAMNYSMLAGGKRLRPLILLESYRMFGGRSEAEAYPFMAALEMIHTHSLVHDDLPALDNDSLRRGKPTTHRVYGEAMAVLAGDALLNEAYETACRSFDGQTDPVKLQYAARALQILTAKTGAGGMLGGQAADVESEGKHVPEERLLFIHKHKTAALLEAPLMIGAVLAGAGDAEVRIMEQIGENTGMAFQIRDDILDVTGSEAVLGKPLHSDEKNEKTTYLTYHTLEEADAAVEQLSSQAAALLDDLHCAGDKTFMRALLLRLADRNS